MLINDSSPWEPWGSSIQSLLECWVLNESLVVLAEGGVSLVDLCPHSFVVAEGRFGVYLRHDEGAEPEVSNSDLVSHQELSSGAVWLQESQELWKNITEIFFTHLLASGWIEILTHGSLTSSIENIVKSIDNHINLLSLHWVIRVVVVLKTQESNNCSGRTTFNM